jgi:beta-N-acetylhexosaminidase
MQKWALLTFLLIASVCLAKESPKPRPISYGPEVDRWAEKTLKKMSLEEKVGQLLMPWSRAAFYNINGPDYAALRDIMKRYHVGGFGLTVAVDGPLLLRNQPYEAAMLTNQLQRDSKYPLLFGADFERGLYMRLNGTTGFPHAMAFGAANNKDYAFNFGRITAEESRAIGVHWNWFPDADVNSNPKNPIINTRSGQPDGLRLHRRSSRRGHAHHRQTFPRTRRHLNRHASRPRAYRCHS